MDLLLGIMLVIGATGLFIFAGDTTKTMPAQEVTEPDVAPIEYKYGFDVTQYTFEEYRIKRNSFMSDILMGYGVDFSKILKLEEKAKDVYSLRKIAAGKNITFVKKDSCGAPHCFIYRPSRLQYVVYNFGDEVNVSKHELPYDICIESASGIIEDNLSNAMDKLGLGLNLVDKMEDALAQVNFFTSQVGDQFKVIFERIYIDGKPSSTGRILSAAYKSGDREVFGFYFANDQYKGYYDYEGTPNKKTFLRAPVRASRISSVFNRNRFHPILKRRRPHLGTDYAARTGTPIMAVANGVVTKRGFTKGNGNYIKIRHDKVYETQYLHMSRFASGIRPGVRVSQGQTIGYVGQTGLATGPHVCFRFWKNGRQINHRIENFPPLNPLPQEELPQFYKVRDDLYTEINQLPYVGRELVFASMAD